MENASDEPMEVVGTAALWIKHPEATGPVEVTFLVTSDMTGPEFLLGWQDMKTMGMLPENFPGLINPQRKAEVRRAIVSPGTTEDKEEDDYLDVPPVDEVEEDDPDVSPGEIFHDLRYENVQQRLFK